MNLYPDLTVQFAQLKSASAIRDMQMPVLAPGSPSQFALTGHHEPSPLALTKGLLRGQLESQL
jgi:hypothetical protein